jgi:hypothetical protein
MPVLEVHRMNRADGSTRPITAPGHLVALDVHGILEVFAREKESRHVDG